MPEASDPSLPPSAVVAAVYDRRTGSPVAGPSAGIDRRYDNAAVRLLLGLIRIYQRVASPLPAMLFGPACGCRFSPTCSHYAAGAVQIHGAFHGTWLTLRRLVKCTPLHPGGFDPVPSSPATRPGCARVSTTPLASGL